MKDAVKTNANSIFFAKKKCTQTVSTFLNWCVKKRMAQFYGWLTGDIYVFYSTISRKVYKGISNCILVVAKVRKKGWFSSRKARDALVIHNSINVIMLRMKYSLGLLRDSSGASFFHNIRRGDR